MSVLYIAVLVLAFRSPQKRIYPMLSYFTASFSNIVMKSKLFHLTCNELDGVKSVCYTKRFGVFFKVSEFSTFSMSLHRR